MIIDANGKHPFEIRDSTGKEFKKIYDADGNLLFKNWNTIQGTPPIVFKGYNRSLKNYKSYGNTIQDGIPTPENPVEVQGCGERTENLFDASMIFEEGFFNDTGDIEVADFMVHTRDYIPIKNSSQYVLTGKLVPTYIRASVVMYDAQKNFISRIRGEQAQNTIVFTTSDNCSYVRLNVNDGYQDFHYDPKTIMLIESSTAPENYIPYGYKLPITVNGTEYPIYLGQVETTRKIYKMRLVDPTSVVRTARGYYRVTFSISSHPARPYQSGDGVCNIARWHGDYNQIGFAATGSSLFITQNVSEWATIESATRWFKENEVYAWYILATPETTITNEPLHKIGDYADTIVMPQAGVTIPTIAGTNTLTVDTTVKSSEIYLKGKIKSLATHMLVDSSGNVLLTSNNYQLVTKEV